MLVFFQTRLEKRLSWQKSSGTWEPDFNYLKVAAFFKSTLEIHVMILAHEVVVMAKHFKKNFEE